MHTGNDPLGWYFKDTDATQQVIEVEESDSEDHLSIVSLQSAGDTNKEELKGVLRCLAESHQQTASHLGTLSTMVTGMNEDSMVDFASRVPTNMGPVKGWHHILGSFDRSQIALVLAVGVRRIEEFEILKGLQPKDDVTPFLRLAKLCGSNTRTIQECYAGAKYRCSEVARGLETKPPRKLQPPEVEGTSESTTESTGMSTITSYNHKLMPSQARRPPHQKPQTLSPFQDHHMLSKGSLEKLLVVKCQRVNKQANHNRTPLCVLKGISTTWLRFTRTFVQNKRIRRSVISPHAFSMGIHNQAY